MLLGQQLLGKLSSQGEALTGTLLPSSATPGARAKSLGVSHLRVSQHRANSQQDVSFKWMTPHVSSSGYTENEGTKIRIFMEYKQQQAPPCQATCVILAAQI